MKLFFVNKFLRVLLLFHVLTVSSCSAKSYIIANSDCQNPPRGDTCVKITNCPYHLRFLQEVKKPISRQLANLFRAFECGVSHDGIPKVCCNLSKKHRRSHRDPAPPDISRHPNLYMINSPGCGKTPFVYSTNFRIVHGTNAEISEFPWMVLLFYRTRENPDKLEYTCGGTLINELYVLTAAHCIANNNGSLYAVRLGEHDIRTNVDCDGNDDSPYCASAIQSYIYKEVIVHPGYDKLTKKNDIALIRLTKRAFLYNENVLPICLPTRQDEVIDFDITEKVMTVAGWGIREDGRKSPVLQKLSLPVLKRNICNKFPLYKQSKMTLTYKQICAGGEKDKDTCGGDSGGPLMYIHWRNDTGIYTQYGIVSYGPRYCGLGPGVYTNVVYYMEWILDNLEP